MERSFEMVLLAGCVTAAIVFGGCDRQQGGYDPKLDGVAPRVAYVDSDTAGVPNILKDPRSLRTAGGGGGSSGSSVRVTTPTSSKAGPESEGPILVPDTAPPVPVPPDIGG